ncbi:hypothetical protein D3C85_1887220 [compost metagenome]
MEQALPGDRLDLLQRGGSEDVPFKAVALASQRRTHGAVGLVLRLHLGGQFGLALAEAPRRQ